MRTEIMSDGTICNIYDHNGYEDKFYKLGLVYHRIDGPAVIFHIDGGLHHSWFYKGIRLNVKTLEEFQRAIKLLAFT